MRTGFEFLASYTFSKSLGDNPGFYGPGWGGYSANSPNTGLGGDGNYNSYDMMLDYGPLWFSSKHNLTLSGAYELPIGKDRKIGSDWSGVTQALLGGWNVSSILTVRSGLPGTTTAGWGPGSSLQNSGFSFERPDRVEGRRSPDRRQRLGQLPQHRGVQAGGARHLRQLGHRHLDGAGLLERRLRASTRTSRSEDRRYLTFRIEAFNLFNHSNKGMPVRDITNPAQFGQILSTANAARVLEFAAKFGF